MNIKILGGGCKKCHKLEDNAKEAVSQMGVDATIEMITDFNDIADYGVMQTPALVIDEQVKAMGKVLTVDNIKKFL